MWTPRMGGKWLQANKCLFVHEMKLKSSKAFEDLLMLSIMTAWKMLMEEVHWMQLSSPMEWAHQPLVWNPNITYVRSRMLGMEVRTPWVYFEKQWWPTMAKWLEHRQEINNMMEIANIKWKKMITIIKTSMWMYHWEAHVLEHGFEGCKWLGRFNARGDIEDIKRVNADA